MNIDDDGTPMQNRQPDESDIGPEPDWLRDDEPIEAEYTNLSSAAAPVKPSPEPEPAPVDTTALAFEPNPPIADSIASTDVQAASPRVRPWMWAMLPFVILLATGIIAWFAGTRSLNDVSTWEALRRQNPAMIPAPWAMLIWWLILPLLVAFLIYGLLPAGRQVTRLKLTGPLISVSLVATCLWVFAQHWQWGLTALVSIGIGLASMLACYLLVVLGPGITKIWQRVLAVIPLSASLAVGVMLTILTWQGYSSQPFGPRGTSVLIVFLLIMMAAVFAFFLRDGLFSLVLAVWFAGVAQQQWGEDAVISLIAIIASLFAIALAVLGTILAMESHRPSLTTNVSSNRQRTSFFRKSEQKVPGELP